MESTEPIPMGAELLRQAASVAPPDRTPAEQLNYWAQLGMHIDRQLGDLPRVLDVAAGRAQFADLDRTERMLAHAVIDARIAEGIAQFRFG